MSKVCHIYVLNKKTVSHIFKCFIVLFLFVHCEQFAPIQQDQIVARVGSNYLYRSDITKQMHPNLKGTDSILFTQSIINSWAKKQILFDKSLFNLAKSKQEQLNNSVENYRLDLFARTYQETLMKSVIDTVISPIDISDYYKENQSNFKLKEDALEIKYIILPKGNIDMQAIIRHFRSNLPEDLNYLDSLSYQFNQYEKRDSIWFNKRDFLSTFPLIEEKNYPKYLKKSQFFMLEDSIEVYLLQVLDYRLRNESAPFSMVENTIRKIVFNRNKLEFIKQFDQDILQDAIQTNKFELFNN